MYRKQRIETNQEKFFDRLYKKHIGEHGSSGLKCSPNNFDYRYNVDFIIDGLACVCKYSKNSKMRILDYGCGVGDWIYLLLKRNIICRETCIVGVDISKHAIDICLKKFKNEANTQFHVIENNKISIEDSYFDVIYMIGVLHHTKNHEELLTELYNKLKIGGKIFILDLSSNNPIINISRKIFTFMPRKIKEMFGDDLVVDGIIPEKLDTNPDRTINILREIGFTISNTTYHHLFVFVILWAIKIMPRGKWLFLYIATVFYKLEFLLLKLKIFQKKSHVFCVSATKQ